MLTIKRADNGWILESDRADLQVFQEGDDEKTAAEAFRDLLYAVQSAIGPDDSRYSKHRIYIDIRPGDKSC